MRTKGAEMTRHLSSNVFSDAHVSFFDVSFFDVSYLAVVLHRGIVNSNINFAARSVLNFYEFCGMGQPSL